MNSTFRIKNVSFRTVSIRMKGIIMGCVRGCQGKSEVIPIEIANFALLDKIAILKFLKIKQILYI